MLHEKDGRRGVMDSSPYPAVNIRQFIVHQSWGCRKFRRGESDEGRHHLGELQSFTVRTLSYLFYFLKGIPVSIFFGGVQVEGFLGEPFRLV
jgi:hypothetical protein